MAATRLRAISRHAAGLLMATAILAGFGSAAARADAEGERWARSFWPTAQAAGVSPRTYQTALGDFTPDPDVLKRASNQAEFVKPIWEYLNSAVSETRLANGKEMLLRHDRDLRQMEARYGVDRHVLVAIWGMESSYGAVFDNPNATKSVVRSLATLAYAGGPRARFGSEQLLAALKILDRGEVSFAALNGSWAGAMGHTQFIPTTYEAYAVDFDGDGRRNIWTSPSDALASAANYLKVSGWVGGKTWGYEVALPRGFDFNHADEVRKISDWRKLGVTRATGAAFPRADDEAKLLLPSGARGGAFLVLRNFSAIKRYNNADAYALAVGHLADRLRGGEPFRTAWPVDELPLASADRAALQKLLADRGFYEGEIDSRLGDSSRAAIRAYQRASGMVADGYPSSRLLQRLRAGG